MLRNIGKIYRVVLITSSGRTFSISNRTGIVVILFLNFSMISLTTPTHDVICKAKSVSASASCLVIVISAVAKVVK